MGYRLLLAEGDSEVARLLVRAFTRVGFDVDVRADADAVLVGLTTGPDLAVLDVGLSDPGGGIGVCRRVRAAGHTLPVLMLIDRTTDIDVVVVRDSGADDCLAKPFRFAELFARIHELLPRPTAGPHRLTVKTDDR